MKSGIGSGGDGSSWETAFTDLFDACEEGRRLDVREYWVAAGTYKPHSGTPADRDRSFSPGVEMYGGFAGNENHRDQRNHLANVTTLSGDIGTQGNQSDNTIRILTSGRVIDGFTIRDGNGIEGVLGTYSGTGIALANGPRRPSSLVTRESVASSSDTLHKSRFSSGPDPSL